MRVPADVYADSICFGELIFCYLTRYRQIQQSKISAVSCSYVMLFHLESTHGSGNPNRITVHRPL